VRQGIPTRGRAGGFPDVSAGGIGTPNPNIQPNTRQPRRPGPVNHGLSPADRAADETNLGAFRTFVFPPHDVNAPSLRPCPFRFAIRFLLWVPEAPVLRLGLRDNLALQRKAEVEKLRARRGRPCQNRIQAKPRPMKKNWQLRKPRSKLFARSSAQGDVSKFAPGTR
jgi:hypothetical protein